MIRLFIAINIPESLKKSVAQAQSILKKNNVNASWVKPENLHISMAFIGNTQESSIPLIQQAVSYAAEAFGTVIYKAKGTGCFGTQYSPRVIWAGIDNDSLVRFESLHRKLTDKLRQLNIQTEVRPFVPHITMARIKSHQNSKELIDLMKRIEIIHPAQIKADSLDIMQSILSPEGAEYKCIYFAPLT